MNKKLISRNLLITILSSASLGSLEIYTRHPPAAIASESTTPLSNLVFNRPEVPPGVDYPGRTSDSGSRGECVALNPHLTALAPKHEVYSEQNEDQLEARHVWGHTLSAHPTIWFNLTEVGPNMTFEVRLEDESGAQVHSFTDVDLPDSPGLFSFTLPDEDLALTEGDRYYWKAIARINCNDAETKTLKVDGWIVRTAPSTNLSTQLSNTTPAERITLLAENGIWFDTLNELIEHQPEQSAFNAAWESLMEPFDFNIEPIFPQTAQ
ncbi:MAG: DUF928 domain-containing protein [Cyanobacteria bacterium P01_F01_bin.150]